MLSAAIAYLAFLGPTETLVPFMVKNVLHGSPSDLGLVFAAGGIGAVGAAFVVGQRGQPRRDITWMYLCWTVATLAVVGYGLASDDSAADARLPRSSTRSRRRGRSCGRRSSSGTCPPSLLGRISSLDWLISISLLPLSFAITGPVADVVGVRATLVGAGLIGAAATFGALFIPGMRDVEGRVRKAPAAPAST